MTWQIKDLRRFKNFILSALTLMASSIAICRTIHFMRLPENIYLKTRCHIKEKFTSRDLHCVGLSNKFIKEEERNLRFVLETVQLQEYHSKIAYLAREGKISGLAELIKSRFMMASPVNIFLQAMTNQLIYSLINRDS